MKLYRFDSDSLIFQEYKWRGRVIGLTLLGFFVLCSFITIKQPEKSVISSEKELIIKTQDEFSKEKLVVLMKDLNIKHSDIVLAQFLIESGGFTSNLFKTQNNIMGMKIATTRPTTAIGEERGYAVYKSWRDCVIDYALYQASFLRGLSREEYFIYLQKNYAEDPNYVAVLKDKIKKG
jgi:hypothetical protein